MKFTLPDQLPVTVAELDELADQATKEIRVYQTRHEAGDELSVEDAERLEYLLDSRDKIIAARDEAASAEQDHTSRLASLLDRANAPAAEESAEDTTDADSDDASESGEVIAEAEQITEEAAEEQQAVAASAQRPVTFAGAAPADQLPDAAENTGEPAKRWELLPSAPRYASFGTEKVTSREIALAIDSVKPGQRTGMQPTGRRDLAGVAFATQAIAKMERPHGTIIEDPQQLHVALDRLADEIPGHGAVSAQTLVASGGWCAPSEQLYDFCDTPAAANLISLPEITIRRGGIRFPAEPDFSELLTGFHFTETELEATDQEGNPTAIKDCVEVPCPDEMVEYRLEAIGWCVKAGILQRQGWPELIQKFIDEFLVAHQYRVSALTVSKMVAASVAKTVPTDAVLGATSGVLNGLHVQARNLQLKTRKATIEGVAPVWFRDVLRADLALREGLDVLAVTDAQIDNWLAVRGIYLQYEHTWQSLDEGKPGHLDTTWWPDSVQVLLYPAGAFFRSLDNVITLGVQYPMEQVQQNRYTHGFVEDAFLVGKRCDPSLLVTVPLCVNGAVGAREQIVCTGADNGSGEGEGEG